MPITAYSNEAKRELDLEQWLALNAYSPQADPQLLAMPDELRAKATRDIECSGCRARGALLVRGALSRANGRPVGQAHFRFGTAGGANPHHPLCDFVEEGKERRNDYLASFASDRSALTRAFGTWSAVAFKAACSRRGTCVRCGCGSWKSELGTR